VTAQKALNGGDPGLETWRRPPACRRRPSRGSGSSGRITKTRPERRRLGRQRTALSDGWVEAFDAAWM